ncbi:DUF3489 domain-containing protein [Novosphingobium sp.]|uniref:DUF3489 domain-containing protein n=1 Tax=Novosphingobium sp. TaxID=1874826 RepID=UPI003D148A3A
MARIFKLDDLHLILLSAASQREDGNVLPFPDSIADKKGGIAGALADLLMHKLVDEAPCYAKVSAWRESGDDRYALIINDKGHAAISLGKHAVEPVIEVDTVVPPSLPSATSKSAAVITLLQRDQGATMPELMEVTRWLPHTTRAALTGLRKKGHIIEKIKRDTATCYRIAAA